MFEHARLPAAPKSTGLIKNLILDGGFALVAALGLAFLLDYLDVTIKTAAEAERRLELPVLGVIPLEAHADLLQTREGRPCLTRAAVDTDVPRRGVPRPAVEPQRVAG